MDEILKDLPGWIQLAVVILHPFMQSVAFRNFDVMAKILGIYSMFAFPDIPDTLVYNYDKLPLNCDWRK